MIPGNVKFADRDIPVLVGSKDKKYLTWAAEFLPTLVDSLDVLVFSAQVYLREDQLIAEGTEPELKAILFNGDDEEEFWYSLMFAAGEQPLGVIFEGHRPAGIVQASA